MSLQTKITLELKRSELTRAKDMMVGAWLAVREGLTIDDLLDVLEHTTVDIAPSGLIRHLLEERKKK